MSNIIKEGWVVITSTMCGDVLTWAEQEQGKKEVHCVFKSIRDAQLEILDTVEEHIRQFKDEEREFEEINFGEEEYIGLYQECEDGTITVSDEEGNPIIETTLEEWRKNR